jgi:hypothetical protein
MKRVERVEGNLIQYGVSNMLANKSAKNSLSLTKIRALSLSDIIEKFGMTKDEANELKKCAERQPISNSVIDCLLSRSNFLCNICKGSKGKSFIIHHIDPYEETQDNCYDNLIVLCPTDHDLAHRSGLTLGIGRQQLKAEKATWETQVERENVRKASRAINIDETAIDYVNVARVEDACRSMFKKIPRTSLSERLARQKILDVDGAFDYEFVKNNLSGGKYLFDYQNSGETDHYRELMQKLSDAVEFVDIEDFMSVTALKAAQLEGRYAYFTGGVNVSTPTLPIVAGASAILMTYRRRRICIEWALDQNYFISMSDICRMRGTVRYTVYCHVRSVVKESGGWRIKASPLLIAPPSIWVDRTPPISYIRKKAQYSFEDDF